MNCTIYLAKTKALISCMVTCTFVFTYAKSRFSYDGVQIIRVHVQAVFRGVITNFERPQYKPFKFNVSQSLLFNKACCLIDFLVQQASGLLRNIPT